MLVARCLPAIRSIATAIFPVLFVLASQSFSAELEPCSECHEEVHIAAEVHSDIECLECHSNLERAPHRRRNLRKLAGDQICIQCHESGAALPASVHSELICEECHGAAHEIAVSSESVCADCHRKASKYVARSVHAEVASCLDCHMSAHTVVPVAGAQSPVAPVNQIKTCSACHDTPPELIDGFLTSVHGKALLVSGLDSAPTCADCHGSHRTKAVDDENAPMSHSASPEMCGSCHALAFAVWSDGSAHGQAWKDGKQDGPLCTTCHESHGIVTPGGSESRFEFPETCGNCHSEYYTTYRDSFHGKATDLDMAAAAICADCHTPHKNLPAADPRSSIHPDNLAETCGACHMEMPASLLSYDPHSNPGDRHANPEVYFTRLFMVGLLLSVFGFFALHDLLWLQRSLVGMARGEFKSKTVQAGPYVRRFSSMNIRLHIVVVVTFLLLAATGLPLKFHWMGWAQPVMNFFGGLESARVIHRLAAIATFGYAGFHLVNILLRAARREKGIFWGFSSMVPQPRDAVDIMKNLRYFLYLGPRPAGDRWAYWEKFDYMAVFWGIPIIGLSGLILWYPNFFSGVLPGWALNAAYIIHSEEALLATGFIFVFHFFHTHMRPESFPMDPVIFTGRMPLARFKEERPLEYQRLVDSDQLHSIAADPPTRSELRNAHIFGFSALTIGIILAIGILWSIIKTGVL